MLRLYAYIRFLVHVIISPETTRFLGMFFSSFLRV